MHVFPHAYWFPNHTCNANDNVNIFSPVTSNISGSPIRYLPMCRILITVITCLRYSRFLCRANWKKTPLSESLKSIIHHFLFVYYGQSNTFSKYSDFTLRYFSSTIIISYSLITVYNLTLTLQQTKTSISLPCYTLTEWVNC